MDPKPLVPALELARRSKMRFPGESSEYRAARTALLAEEIELRRHLERVAAQRRALPPGRLVDGDYRFRGEAGTSDLVGLFGRHDTLIVYSFMFGPDRERACPMCTNFLGPLDQNARDIEQKVALAVVARSPVERLVAFKRERGWRALRLFQDTNDVYSRDYNGIMPDGSDGAAINVFTRANGEIRHFWSGEMGAETADPGQDPRGAPDIAPLWNFLDMTPDGRDPEWYPELEYSGR